MSTLRTFIRLTGMRRKELCGLQLHQVPDVAHLDIDEAPLVGVPLIVTTWAAHTPVTPAGKPVKVAPVAFVVL